MNDVPPHFHTEYRISEKDIIPNGDFVSVVPDWPAPEGTEVTYLNGSTFRRYRMVDGTWREIGGGAVAGNDKDIQFNNAGVLDGDDTFRWDRNTRTLSLGVEDNASGATHRISGTSDLDGDGTKIILEAGDGGTGGDGGSMQVRGGDGDDTGNGGFLSLRAGAAGANGDGANVELGASDGVNGGNTDIFAGQTTGGGLGGSILLRNSRVPSSASDTGTPGAIAWDSDYIYICVAI